MDILFLLILSPIVFFAGQFLQKKTTIAPPIVYLLLGIIFGGSAGVCHIFGNADILPNMANYNTTALLLMFLGAGFSMDLKMLKNSGKVTTQLFTLPVNIEAILMTVIVFFGLQLLPSLGLNLSLFELGIIMPILACASPANVIPICMSHNHEGYTGKNRITNNMIAAAVCDNFTMIPLLFLAMIFSVVPRMGLEFTPMKVILLILGMIVGMVGITLGGVFIGFILTKILNPVGKKVADAKDNRILPIIYSLLYFIILAVIVNLSGPLKSAGILIVVAAGAGIKKYEKNSLADKLNFNLSVLFAMFGSPIIFIYVGSLIDIKKLLNPVMLLFGVIVTVLAFTIKGLVTRYILRDEKYTDGERKFAMSCFLAKGISLVNFSLILMPIFIDIGLGHVINFMIMLAAISIIITIPLGVTLMNNAKGKWLQNNNLNETKMGVEKNV